MLSWFKVDIHVRNDPKVRAVRAKYGPAGMGNLLGLWSYVASEGSKTDPGVGVDSAGAALNLDVMAPDLDFPDTVALRDFLTFLASVGLIETDVWADRGIVILPAMRTRAAAYRKSKGRTLTGRPPGRPRKPRETPGNSFVTGLSVSDAPAETPGNPAPKNVEIRPEKNHSEIAGNSGETPGITGNPSSLGLGLPGIDLHLEEPTEDQTDPRKGPLTPARLVRLWNGLRDPGPKVMDLTKNRRELYARAIKAKPDPEDWVRAIEYLNSAPWANACGEGTHANYRADLDYLAKPGGVTKALERLAARSLPGARPARHTGRVQGDGKSMDAVRKRQEAEDDELRKAGLLT